MPGPPPPHELFARAALPAYGRPADTPLRLLGLSENATFLAGAGDATGADDTALVLRVHRPGYHSLAAIRSELRWMEALGAQTDVSTPELIVAQDGRDVVTAKVGAERRYVDAVSFIPGCTVEAAPHAVGYDAVGRVSAVMHDHARTWKAPASFTRFRWDVATTLGPRARWGDWRHAPGYDRAGLATVERAATEVAHRLAGFGTGGDRFGLVHADLRMSNLMVDPARPGSPVTVIDFDDCGWSWYLADVAAVVSFVEDTAAAEAMIADWLHGYRSVVDLPPGHAQLVPTLVMLRRLALTAWVASRVDADHARAFSDGFAAGTAALAGRYLTGGWLSDAIG